MDFNYVFSAILTLVAGIGIFLIACNMMSSSMESFAYLDSVKNFLASIDNILLLVLVGAVVTAIVQSSSVMTSVAITMVVAGLISLTLRSKIHIK